MKRLTFFSKLILFLTAYIPLGIICLIIDYKEFQYPYFNHGKPTLGLLITMIILPLLLYLLIRHFRNRASGWEKLKVITANNMDNEILSYIFTYILPFLGFPEERRLPVVIFLLFVIGILYIRSDMIGINPLLAIFGYHIIKVEWTKDNWQKSKEAMLISKLDYFEVKQRNTLDAIQVKNELFLVKGEKDD